MVASVLFSIVLATTLFAAGFACCALPPTTYMLSKATCLHDLSPYSEDQLSTLAVATRDLTVDMHIEGEHNAAVALAARVMDTAYEAAHPSSAKSVRWEGVLDWHDAPGQGYSTSNDDALRDMYDLASYDSSYALDQDAVAHLLDCNRLIVPASIVVACAALAALLLGLALRKHRVLFARALIAAPALLLSCMVGLGAWALVDFNGFFAAFHAVLFPSGNWVFPADSLLISMLPQGFWMGMGIIWLTATVLACIISMLAGCVLIRKDRSRRARMAGMQVRKA